jgi:hypothetical protein
MSCTEFPLEVCGDEFKLRPLINIVGFFGNNEFLSYRSRSTNREGQVTKSQEAS